MQRPDTHFAAPFFREIAAHGSTQIRLHHRAVEYGHQYIQPQCQAQQNTPNNMLFLFAHVISTSLRRRVSQYGMRLVSAFARRDFD